MLLAFAPFIVFAVIDQIGGPTVGLVAAAVTALALLARDTLVRRRSAKLLEIGTALLFGGLALATSIAGAGWSVLGIRLCVDGGLLAIVLGSMLLGRPFTLQYAREQVPEAMWDNPGFIRTNAVITAAWALAFGVMVLADLALLCLPSMPRGAGVVAIVLAMLGAFRFTGWYAQRARRLHRSS